MAKKENGDFENKCSKCGGLCGMGVYKEKGSRVYGQMFCERCGNINPKRIRFYFGFGEKGGRTHINHEQLGKVELAQL